MHTTAIELGKIFFNTYTQGRSNLQIVEIGSQDVNGSLRSVAPSGHNYLGLDFQKGPGVDVILTDPYLLPLQDNCADLVVCSSCFEHSEFFWLLFNEIQRILKPNGIAYLNMPANGVFHRYPVDCWRFYPDSGVALQNWARRSGFKTVMLESFTSKQKVEDWNDFVAVFLKDSQFVSEYPKRMLSQVPTHSNGLLNSSSEFTNPQYKPEDQRIIDELRPTLKKSINYLWSRLSPKILFSKT